MKHLFLRLISWILLICISFYLVGCGSYEMEPAPATYFHIDNSREYYSEIPVNPIIQSNYVHQFAVIPAEEHVRSSVSTKLCINNTTNELVMSENPFDKIYPASITKIMTALLVLERGNLEDTVTVTEDIELNDPLAVTLGLQVGDSITVKELMHGMLITSANDCAVMLGRYISGSDSAFVELMNQRASDLGATHTHFVNPHGLHSEEHYTTGYDLYLIYKELIKHEEFKQIAGIAQYTIHYTNSEGVGVDVPISNSNQFITSAYSLPEGITVISGKTGTTSEAGYCLIVEATDKNGQDYIGVICGASSRNSLYIQMQQLLSEINQVAEITSSSCTSYSNVL